jgi:porin
MWAAREVARWVRGTASSYAWATQAGLSRLGSNMTLTSSVLVVFGSRRAMTASSLPLNWDVVRLHHRQRCAQKPSPIAGVKLLTRDARRELYDIFCNIVGSVFTQFLAKFFGIYLGKIDTFSGDANAFAHEWKTQFMNTGLGPNPVLFTTIPYSTLGAGFLLLPTESVVFNFSALSPGGTANSAGFDELFEKGVALAAELRVGIKPFGLPGHQLIGGTYNTQTYTSLAQDPRTSIDVASVLSGEIPLRDALSEVQISRTSGSWSVYYNFDQFLYTTTADGSQGIGIFGRIGFADRNTNILEQFYSFGIGGRGMLPGRDHDRFGIGFYYTNLSNDLPGLILSDDEIGLEIFYNIAATNWFYVTPDIQVIEPVGRRATTAFLTGLRVQMRF